MKRSLIVLTGVIALSATAVGQTNDEKYQAKLKKEFVSKAAWVQTLTEARAKAAEEKKLIFGYFTRSYSP